MSRRRTPSSCFELTFVRGRGVSTHFYKRHAYTVINGPLNGRRAWGIDGRAARGCMVAVVHCRPAYCSSALGRRGREACSTRPLRPRFSSFSSNFASSTLKCNESLSATPTHHTILLTDGSAPSNPRFSDDDASTVRAELATRANTHDTILRQFC